MTEDSADRDLRAAEYVLGTLPAAERAAMDLERIVDPETDRAVRAWERRLSPLAAAIPPVVPEARVWERIARALPRQPAAGAANDNRIAGLSRQVRIWRAAALGAGALAAVLALAVTAALRPAGPAPARYVAVVTSGGETPAMLVSVDLAAGTAQVRPVGAKTPDGHSLELWYVEGGAPKTLGVIAGAARQVALPAGGRSADGVFAVSVEPPGGSPTGLPTGPVIYSGKLIRD